MEDDGENTDKWSCKPNFLGGAMDLLRTGPRIRRNTEQRRVVVVDNSPQLARVAIGESWEAPAEEGRWGLISR